MQISVDSAVAYLESRGFVNKKQNLGLLKKANYNAELVADFLAAKQALVNATNSDDQKKPFGLRRKLAKETQPELFAKFIEAKKALHSRKPSDIPVESEEPLKDKRCPLTKEERIARKEQRLRLKSQLESKEEEERAPVASPTPIPHASVALDDNVKEEDVEPKKRNFLTKEERITRKLQRIQLKAANINNKDLNLKTEEEEDKSTAPAASEEQVPRRGRLSKEERLARKETRLKLKLTKLSQKQQQEEEEESKDIKQEDSDSDATIQRRRKCVGKLTKEEKLARKEERLKLKEARLNLKQQRLAKREGIHIAPRVTTVFIDGSSFSKSQSEIAEMAKTLVEKNSQVEKIVILYEGVEIISQSMEKIVIASATPLFESVQDAVKILALKIADKKTMSVISGNKSWIQEMRKEGVSAIVPFF